MAGINHETLVVYYCSTHITDIPVSSVQVLFPSMSHPKFPLHLVDGEGWLQMRETQQGRTGAAGYEAQHLHLALQKVLPHAQYDLGFCFGTYYDLS